MGSSGCYENGVDASALENLLLLPQILSPGEVGQIHPDPTPESRDAGPFPLDLFEEGHQAELGKRP